MRKRVRSWLAAGAVAAVTAAASVVAGVTAGLAPTATDLALPIRAAFTYEWFPEAEGWGTQYHPALGKYDSSNPTVVATHMAELKWSGINAAILSWWGTGSPTDNRMPTVLDAAAAQGVAVTAYYEPEGTADPSVAQVQADVARLNTLAQHPAWLRVGGKPVLFVYNANDTTCSIVDKWRAAAPGWYLQLKVFSGYASCPSQPDSWHQYGPASPLSKHGAYAMNASPGFWRVGEATPRLVRDLSRWRIDLSTMADSAVQWQLITSLNEWGEGTAVEPATEWQTSTGMGEYLTAMRDVFVTGQRFTPTSSSTVPTTTSTTSTTSSSATSVSTASSSTPTTSTTSAQPPGSNVSKVLVIVEENHSLAQMQAGMPYLAAQAAQYGYATNYTAIRHPSLPNYLAIAGGSTFGVTDDAAPSSHPISGRSVFGAAITAGKTARSYQEGMTSNCKLTNTGRYAVKHNPWAYFVDERTACNTDDVPSGTTTSGALRNDIVAGALPNVGELTPDLCNDAHDCSLTTADNWLKGWLELIYASPDWQAGRLAVVVTADEDNGSQGNKVLTVVIHPSQSHKVVTTALTHYSLTRLLTQVSGAPCIAAGCTAPNMAAAFALPLA